MRLLANKLPFPEINEDILETLETTLLDAGVAIPAEDTASAGVIADEIVAAGRAINDSHPIHFIIGGRNLYIYNGERLRPANLTAYWSNRFSGDVGNWQTIPAGTTRTIVQDTKCPARPYDRMIDCDALLNINVGSGGENVAGFVIANIHIEGTKYMGTWLDEATNTEGAMIVARQFVDAGHSPDVKLTLTAYSAAMQYRIAGNIGARLRVVERPCTMDL